MFPLFLKFSSFHKNHRCGWSTSTIQYINTIQILLSTPHGGFSETNINSTGNLTSSFTAFHWFNLIEFTNFLQILLFLQLHVNVHLSRIWYRLNIHRPFWHYVPVSRDKEIRTRLWWRISYKSLYFVHLSLELVPLFTGMLDRSIGQALKYKTGAIYLNQLDHFNTTQLQWTIWNILQGNWLPVFFVVLIPLKNKKPNK